MRRHLVRWGIVVAAVATAGALPGGGPQRIHLNEMPEAVSTVKTTVYGDRGEGRIQDDRDETQSPARTPQRY